MVLVLGGIIGIGVGVASSSSQASGDLTTPHCSSSDDPECVVPFIPFTHLYGREYRRRLNKLLPYFPPEDNNLVFTSSALQENAMSG